jgi:hypothetical protein
MQALPGLATPALQVEAGYRRARKFRPLYGPDYYVAQGYDVRTYGCCVGQSDEIRELRRAFPQTNWPPSALAGHAQAVSPLPFKAVAPLAVPVTDQEEQAVEEHLNAADMPTQPEGGAPQQNAPQEHPAASSGAGDVEEKELQMEFPSTDGPKK